MEAERSTGIYERAVQGIRRLTALTLQSDDADVVREALVRELQAALDLPDVSVVRGDQADAERAAEAQSASVECERRQPVAGGGLVLELRSPAQIRESVVLLASAPRVLGADEATAAAALVDVAAVALGLQSAQRQATTDELTGCLSRRAVLTRLREEIARSQRAGWPVSCLMLDVDKLKQINDTFGHLEGDRVLREAGASLRGQLRAYDVAARYGGDEFLVLLPSAERPAALHAGARMAAAVARISAPANATARVPVSVTFGAATSRPGDLPDSLVHRADQALLNAKRRGHSLRRPSR